MGTSGWLATVLDAEMIEGRSGLNAIASRLTPEHRLNSRTGIEVWHEIGGRFLLRYLLPEQVGQFRQGTTEKQYVTPTPFSPEETVRYLALPRPAESRPFALVLEPRRIDEIRGPRWVRAGRGIEYILPRGFSPHAVVTPGSTWEMQVT